MRYYIGIDGGGTKTKFTLAGEDGHVIRSCTGPTCHYLQCGADGLTDVLRKGIDTLSEGYEISRMFIGCAGYGDVTGDTPMLDEAIKTAAGDIPFDAGNDCENALAGALGGETGINIIAGTGSMGCGVNSDGKILRCGGWHHAIGSDEGSAYWIGWRILKEFLRQSDGRDAVTDLYSALKDRLAISSDDQIITRVVEEWDLDRTKIASIAPLCAELYEAGDPFAVQIINDAARELADIAIALYRRLGFGSSADEAPVKVSGTGGVFRMGRPLTEPFASILSAEGMEYVPPLYEPDIGSVILAMKADSISCLPDIR